MEGGCISGGETGYRRSWWFWLPIAVNGRVWVFRDDGDEMFGGGGFCGGGEKRRVKAATVGEARNLGTRVSMLRGTRRGGQCFRANGRGPALCRVGIRTRYKFDGKPSVAPSPRVGNHPQRKLFSSRFGTCPEGVKRIIIKETRKLPPSRKAKSCSSTSTRDTHAHMHQPSAQCPMRGVTLSHSIPLYTTDVTTN